MFAIALQAWKAGGGWRELPVPNVACSGIPVKAPVEEWTALAKGDERLENALVRLHILFQEADTLGSLIDPKRATEISDPTGLQRSIEDVDWEEVAPLIKQAAEREATIRRRRCWGRTLRRWRGRRSCSRGATTLVATNVPLLCGAAMQARRLRVRCDRHHHDAQRGPRDGIAWTRARDARASGGALRASCPRTGSSCAAYRSFASRTCSTS